MCGNDSSEDGSSDDNSEALSCSGTGTSGSDGEKSSDNGSDGDNKKGGYHLFQ